jgi:hypothetical protein
MPGLSTGPIAQSPHPHLARRYFCRRVPASELEDLHAPERFWLDIGSRN